jgi:hypothetical protein
MEKTFIDIQDNIENLINEIDYLGKSINVDGIINPKKYAKSKTRILWVLKEPNSKKSWTYQDYLSITDIETKKDTKENILVYPIFRKIIYASYGLINNKKYADLPVAEEKEVYAIGEKIAYINIKKTGGVAKSDDKEIQESYNEHEELLLKQIKEYNPHILILGNTLKYFNLEQLKKIGWDLSDKHVLDKETNNTHFYPISEDKLCINAYHPAYWRVNMDIYCTEIINAGLQWREMNK